MTGLFQMPVNYVNVIYKNILNHKARPSVRIIRQYPLHRNERKKKDHQNFPIYLTPTIHHLDSHPLP